MAAAPRHGGLLGGGIALLIVGGILVLIGGALLIFIGGIFLLGGGGNVDAFTEQTGGVTTTGTIIAIAGALMIVGGIVMLVVRSMKRKRAVRG